MSGETLVELVATPAGVDVYVSEEDEPVAATNYTAKLTQTTGATRRGRLETLGANKLAAAGFQARQGGQAGRRTGDKSGAKIFATFQAK
jgi:hypothetical protein